ncbi:hypothetical protein QSV34_03185 [Porticoccus sp. W117]|uniref:hypothetical protein n=1 Tax=Porticoccus sp. W117 TaxID=3054777 RepID=UPI0025944906|nr:hypothetical protein [Porticoccus sp. W117]MDM3870353.1 hypothetical protein [Porticoccus sp. W117]
MPPTVVQLKQRKRSLKKLTLLLLNFKGRGNCQSFQALPGNNLRGHQQHLGRLIAVNKTLPDFSGHIGQFAFQIVSAQTLCPTYFSRFALNQSMQLSLKRVIAIGLFVQHKNFIAMLWLPVFSAGLEGFDGPGKLAGVMK